MGYKLKPHHCGYDPNWVYPEDQEKCPRCGADPCACDYDEELDASRQTYAPNKPKSEDTVTKPACQMAVDGFCYTHKSMACYVSSEQFDGFVEAVKPKHKPLPARALTSWPGLHSKMEAAKLLNELKDE